MTPLRLAIIPLAFFISACANTGPADDGFENSNESIDIGKIHAGELLSRVLKRTEPSENTGEDNKNQ